MRLIDADKLMLSLSDWELQNAPLKVGNQPKEFTSFDMDCMVWRTIRDCESAVEEQPTVKAIPIEWLINYEIKNGQETRLQEAITQWEKENDRNQT